MRILMVTHQALPHIGGLETAVDSLTRALAARGHEVEQLAPAWKQAEGEAVADPHPGQVPQHRRPALHLVERVTGRPFPVPGRAFARFVRERAAESDAVHAHGFLFPTTGVALRAANRAGGPARVLTDHASVGAYASKLLNPLESVAVGTVGQMALRNAEAVVALNTRIERQIAELRPGKLIVTIPNGVDHDLYRPGEGDEPQLTRAHRGWDRRPRVLFVGRMVPRKGADIAVEIARQMRGEAELVLVGPGDPGELPPNATALGSIPPDEVAQLYRAADVLLLPSHNEGFPMTVMESMASGLPVVVADDPAYESYLGGAPPGVERRPREAGALLEALRELEFGRGIDRDGREEIASFARERFSWERSAAEHEALYERLLAPKRARG
jgi:glycosyltransferase involved in cell wall biosynthesis